MYVDVLEALYLDLSSTRLPLDQKGRRQDG